jgi:hypothetical protein
MSDATWTYGNHLCFISFEPEFDPNLKSSVSASQKTHWISITKANQAVLFSGIIAVLLKNAHRYMLCAKCRVFVTLE